MRGYGMFLVAVCWVIVLPGQAGAGLPAAPDPESPGAAQAGTIAGKVTATGVKDARDTVVYIEKIEGHSFEPPVNHATIDQVNKEFVPHVLPILAGTPVDFRNSDEVAHDVFSPDKAVAPGLKFNPWLRGGVRSYTFTTPGVAALLCHIHAEMSAYILVLETPYAAVTAEDGRYRISGVPPGTYTLKTWHERLKPVTTTVTVKGENTVEVNVELK